MKKLPTSTSKSVSAFLADSKKHPLAKHAPVRLVFAMDATGSRGPSWDLATSLHGELFKTAQAKNLAIQLVYYGGFNEFHVSSWSRSSHELLRTMQDVRCKGGVTQIERVLRHTISEAQSSQLKALVFVGDCCEESPDTLYQLAGQLGMYRIPAFMFQEGNDPIAFTVFSGVAERTNGAHIPFQPGSVHQLAELLGAVATFATGGVEAVNKLKGRFTQNLLTQLRS